MKDFNFFSPYLLEKQNKRLKRRFTAVVSFLLAIGLLSFTAINVYQIKMYKAEISKVESYINSKETIELLNKYEEVSQRLQLLNSYYNIVNKIDSKLDSYDTVSTELLDKLSSAIPQAISMSHLMISKNKLEMSFVVTNLIQVAELEHNLKALNIFETVHVNIIENQTSYTAMISCKLKDVEIREAKTVK